MACGCGLAGTVRPVTSPGVVDRVYTPRVLAVFAATALYFSVGGLSFPVLPRLVERRIRRRWAVQAGGGEGVTAAAAAAAA